ncbi:MAG: helix-turn-helix transcriptional regulator [Gemmatimonadetes bacterium]|nr:helix-turn-helix transcriptional regulator [Gemmatimonadota bacterium]
MMISTRPRRAIDARGERILAAALTEFVERGFRRARLSTIARAAAVSPRTFRRYFPDKAELFREVVRTTILELVRGSWRRSSAGRRRWR